MGFQVKYEEITSIRELILAQLDRWIEQIDVVRSSIVEIAAMSEMHGEAAEHVRSYMWDYHMNLANMIKDTIETYRSSFILYTDWYYNIDSDQKSRKDRAYFRGHFAEMGADSSVSGGTLCREDHAGGIGKAFRHQQILYAPWVQEKIRRDNCAVSQSVPYELRQERAAVYGQADRYHRRRMRHS